MIIEFIDMKSSETIIRAFRQYSHFLNYRKSSMREAVLLFLWNSSEFKDADTIFSEIHSLVDNVKIGNIYNALRWLTNEGFLKRDFPEKRGQYCIDKQYCIEQ